MKATRPLKNLLLPHPGNHYRPHLVRRWGLLTSLMAVLLVQLSFNYLASGRPQVLGYVSTISTEEIVILVNQQRQKSGLKPLEISAKLQAAAQAKAVDMLEQDYWGHYAPDGTPPWQFIADHGYRYAVAGENLAKGFDTSAGVLAGWLNSAAHRQNLLSDSYSELGVGVIEGELDGQATTLVVAMLARPQSFGAEFSGGGEVFAAASSPVQFSLVNPLPVQATLNWAAKATIPLLLILITIFLTQHLIVVKKHLKWDKRPHRHPLVLAAGLLGVVAVMLITSFGIVL